MSESEIFVCKQCGKEHEASTQEISSYSCPNMPKSKSKIKVLDCVSAKCLTGFNTLSETQDPKHIKSVTKEDSHEEKSK